MTDLTTDDFDYMLKQWGNWAYVNVDKLMGAKAPGWVHSMKRGYERDERIKRQSSIPPMDDEMGGVFDKIVCTLNSIDREYWDVIVLTYCFRYKVTELDDLFEKPKNYHSRLKSAAFKTLHGVYYGLKMAG